MSYFNRSRGRPKNTTDIGPTLELLRKKKQLFGHTHTDSPFSYLCAQGLLNADEQQTAEHISQLWQRLLWLKGTQLRRSSCSLFEALGRGAEPPDHAIESLKKKLGRIERESQDLHPNAFPILKRWCLLEDNLYDSPPRLYGAELRILKVSLQKLAPLFSS